MKNLRTLTFAGLAGAALLIATSLPAPAQVQSKSGGYLLRIKWAKGKVYNYTLRSSATVPGNSNPISVDVSYVATVQGVDKGVATVKFETKGAPQGGNQAPQVLKMDSRGKIVDGQRTGFDVAELPEQAVRVGGKWTKSQTLPSMLGPMDVKTTYTFKGLKKVNGKSVAEISLDLVSTGQNLSGTGKGTMHLDPADGMLVTPKINQTMTFKSEGKSTVMPVEVTIKRN